MRIRLLIGLIALGALWTSAAASPMPAMACSCAALPMADFRGDEHYVIFEGEIAAAGPAGVDVLVERWYQGIAASSISLDPSGFGGNGAGCEANWPTVGSRWLYAAWVEQPGARPQVNLCTPQARLGAAGGDELVAEVRAAFGEGTVVPVPSEAPPQVTPGPLNEPGAAPVVLAAVGLAVALVFGAVLVAARLTRRRPSA